MNEINIIALSIVGFAVGFVLAYFVGSRVGKAKIGEAEERKKLIIEEAGKEAAALKKEKLLEVKEEWHKNRQEFENETQDRRKQIKQLEQQMSQREESIENKLELDEPLSGNIYQNKKAKSVPGNLREAIDLAKKSKLLPHIFEKDVLEHYIHAAEWEQSEYDKSVNDWEHRRYFERG